jgi:hypothetical protein
LENELTNAALDKDNGVIGNSKSNYNQYIFLYLLGSPQIECERDHVHFKVLIKKLIKLLFLGSNKETFCWTGLC